MIVQATRFFVALYEGDSDPVPLLASRLFHVHLCIGDWALRWILRQWIQESFQDQGIANTDHCFFVHSKNCFSIQIVSVMRQIQLVSVMRLVSLFCHIQMVAITDILIKISLTCHSGFSYNKRHHELQSFYKFTLRFVS